MVQNRKTDEHSFGNWLKTNIIALGSLIVAIIALVYSCRTDNKANSIAEKQIAQDKELVYINNQLDKEKDEYDHVKEVVYELYSGIIRAEIAEPSLYSDSNYRKLYLVDSYQDDLDAFLRCVDDFVVFSEKNSLVLPSVFKLEVATLNLLRTSLDSAYKLMLMHIELKGEKSKELDDFIDNYEKQLSSIKECIDLVKEDIEGFFSQLDITASTLLEDNS